MTVQSSRGLRALLILVALVSVGVMVASSADDGGWQATYWNNPQMEGSPVLTRNERVIDNVYGESSPAPGTVNNDYFSARWTQTVNLQPGTYRFTMSSDDGSRVIVNGVKVLDQWYDHSLRTASAEMELPGGDTQITVEYYDSTFAAVASFKYDLIKQADAQSNVQQSSLARPAPQEPVQQTVAAAPEPAPVQVAAAAPAVQQRSSCANAGFSASYFNSSDLSGPAVLNRTDPSINFDWGEGSPGAGVNTDGFSVSWNGRINLQQGSYLIALSGDDGLRMALNGEVRVNDWYAQGLTTRTFNLDHAGGPISIRVDHFDAGGYSLIGLTCTRLGDYNGPPLQVGQVGQVGTQVQAAAQPVQQPVAAAPAAQPVAAQPAQPAQPAAQAVTASAEANIGVGTCQISNVYHLNLREGPSLNSAVVGRVSYGEMTTLTGQRSGKYVHIRDSGGEEGWVNRYYCGNAELPQALSAEAPAAATVEVAPAPEPVVSAAPACNSVTVTSEALMVRGGPDISHLWYDVAYYGDTLCLTGHRNQASNWIEVTTQNGIRGWVFVYYTTTTQDQLYALTPTQ